MPDIPSHFAAILGVLRQALGGAPARTPRQLAVFVFLWTYLLRTAARLERLHAHWLAGTLPKPRPARARRTPGSRPIHDPPRPPLPRGRAWLVRAIGYHAAGAGSQLQHFLARTDVLHFLHAAPQAGRLLRPLCRLLGAELPPLLALPPRPPRSRPPRPPAPPPVPEPHHGKYSPAQIRRYRPGRIPARKTALA